jgi:hypothetical protein
MGVGQREGWSSSASSRRGGGSAESGVGIDAHHAHDSARMRIVPAGTAGTVGPSPHHALRQGVGDPGVENGKEGAEAAYPP